MYNRDGWSQVAILPSLIGPDNCIKWCSVRFAFAQTGLALAVLLVFPVLSVGSRAQAGYVPVTSLCQKAVSPVAKDRWCGADPDVGGASAAFEPLPSDTEGKEEVSPPNSRPFLPALLRQAFQFASPRGGGMTQPSGGPGSGGSSGPLAGLPSQVPDLGPEACVRFSPNNPVFVPSPTLSGLFRPPRAVAAPCA